MQQHPVPLRQHAPQHANGKLGTAVAAGAVEVWTDICKKENLMTMTTIRVSDTEVQVERTLYTFAQKNDADCIPALPRRYLDRQLLSHASTALGAADAA